MDNRGKDMRDGGASDCSKAPEVEIGRSSEISNILILRCIHPHDISVTFLISVSHVPACMDYVIVSLI